MSDVKKIIMRFPVEDGTPRMFVAFMDSKKGVLIHDIDNDKVVAQGIMKGHMRSLQVFVESMLQGIDWGAFSKWLAGREQYKPPFEGYDLGADKPNPGNAMAQIRYTPQAGEWIDARTPEMISQDRDPRNPVSFPPASYEDMAMTIAAHDKVLDARDGRSRISWTLPVSLSNIMGEPGDGEMTDPDHDDAWDEHAASEDYREEILSGLADKIFSNPLNVYNVTDDGVVSLESHRGLPMSFGSMEELLQKCKGMKADVVAVYSDIRMADAKMKKAPEMVQEMTIVNRQKFEAEQNMPSSVNLG